MIAKIKAQLLARYPLLWNTRIVFLLPALLAIHILFYIAGFFKSFSLGNLHESYYYRYEGVVMFSVLLTALLVVIWLLFYLRNNALKAGYPLKCFHLIKEFMLLMVVFFASSTFFFTYQQGVFDRSERETNGIDIVEEVNQANLAFHFIATDQADFRIYRSCDSIAAREKRRQERLDEYYRLRDAGLKAEGDMINNEPINEDLDSLPLSYLYYCTTHYSIGNEGELTPPNPMHARAHTWLLSGNRDSVINQLMQLKILLAKYDIDNNLDPITHASSIFSTENFKVDTIYGSTNTFYDQYQQEDIPQAFIHVSEFQETINRIEEVRMGFWNVATILSMLYYAFAMALLLMSFRMTSIRVWFAALIGSGIVALLVSLLVISSNQGDFVLYFIGCLYGLFFLGSVALIRTRNRKFFSGILFLWTLWMQLSILPMIWGKLEDYHRHGYYDNAYEATNPTYQWITSHWHEMLEFNLILTLLLLAFVFMPLAKKWQANPEE